FLAGMASILSPCVLPLIPIVIGYSVLKRGLKEILAFTGGFFLIFAVITVLTVIFTAALNSYLLYIRIVAAILLVLVGLFFIINPQMPRLSLAARPDGGVVPSFLLGLLTCLAWSPCFGPYVVAVAAYSASTGNVLYSALNMILFAAGFSLTMFILALLSSRINFERISKYSNTIRIISGLFIVIAGIYMLWGLI
ncbi:MAG: cytochrome c biogenesis CcdA family protein, partial [Methanobacteriaceae archaeon]|nr:cytochrome c biogenesis CcdA family protein [Methanobacteriaceae archaeon]